MSIKENDNESDNEEAIVTVKIYYSGKDEEIEINKEKTINDLKLSIISLLNINFTNYDLVYKLQSLGDSNNGISLERLIGNEINPSFILRKKEIISKRKRYDTAVILESFPSFMDLSEQMKIFCSQSKTEIDFHLDYKHNWCKVSFSDAESAFSFVSFITHVKWTNKLYHRIKINMSYAKPKDKNKIFLSQCTTSSKSTKHSDSHQHKNHLFNNKYQPIKTDANGPITNRHNNYKSNGNGNGNGNYNIKQIYHNKRADKLYCNSDLAQSDYLISSEPYVSYHEILQKEYAHSKKKWTNRKNFFSSVGKYSMHNMLPRRPKVYMQETYGNIFA